MDTASPKPGDLVLPVSSAQPSAVPSLVQELFDAAEGAQCGLSCEEFALALTTAGEKVNYGLAAGGQANAEQKAHFFRSLRLSELALAHGCSLGREVAWQRFLNLYRAPLTQASVAIAGSSSLGHELADSLYAELYGLRELDGQRRSPLASYSGRGSLLGWLRTTIAQRHVDHHRRTRREAPLPEVDPPAIDSSMGRGSIPGSAELTRLTDAVRRSLQTLAAQERFVLCSYFLDHQTLLAISRVLGVHEATVSRQVKRLMSDLRRRLVENLQSGGLSKRAAEELLGTDPRDIELNMRALLQTSQNPPFSDRQT